MTFLSLDISPAGAWRYWLRNSVVFKRTWLLGLMALARHGHATRRGRLGPGDRAGTSFLLLVLGS